MGGLQKSLYKEQAFLYIFSFSKKKKKKMV